MFTTFTDWEFDGNVENATQNAKNFWPEMKAAGAVSMRATETGPNSIRTMTLWSSKQYLQFSLAVLKLIFTSKKSHCDRAPYLIGRITVPTPLVVKTVLKGS